MSVEVEVVELFKVNNKFLSKQILRNFLVFSFWTHQMRVILQNSTFKLLQCSLYVKEIPYLFNCNIAWYNVAFYFKVFRWKAFRAICHYSNVSTVTTPAGSKICQHRLKKNHEIVKLSCIPSPSLGWIFPKNPFLGWWYLCIFISFWTPLKYIIHVFF